MDYQRSSRFGHSQRSTPASNTLIPKHICLQCGKSRSKRYHYQHPLLPGQVPEPGICSRPKCAKAVNEILIPACQVIVYETHYHYHSSPGPEEPPPSYTTTELRLPTSPWSRHSSRNLSPIREEWSPQMNISFGAEASPPNNTAAELSGDSSLAGRAELPDNMWSRRHAFRRLSPVTEESPPPVNFLKKPTL